MEILINIATGIAAAAAVLAAFIGILFLIPSSGSDKTEDIIYDTEKLKDQVARHETSIGVLNDQLNTFKKTASSLSKISKDAPINLKLVEFNTQLERFELQLENFNRRLRRIEQVIMDNPERVFEAAFLRQKLEHLEQHLNSTRTEVSRVHDHNRWFIGLLITLAIGLLGLAITNFLPAPPAPR